MDSKNVPALNGRATTPAFVLRDVKQNIRMTFSIHDTVVLQVRQHSDNYYWSIILQEGVQGTRLYVCRPAHTGTTDRLQPLPAKFRFHIKQDDALLPQQPSHLRHRCVSPRTLNSYGQKRCIKT